MSNKTELQRDILITAHDNPQLSKSDIARRVDCSDSYVGQVLSRYDSHDAMQARIEELNRQLGVDTGNSGLGMIGPTPTNQSSTESIDADYRIPEEGIDQIGPIGALVLAVMFGGYLLFSNPLSDSMSTVRWGIIVTSALVVIAVVVMTYREYRNSGVGGAVSWLLGNGENEGPQPSPRKGASKRLLLLQNH